MWGWGFPPAVTLRGDKLVLPLRPCASAVSTPSTPLPPRAPWGEPQQLTIVTWGEGRVERPSAERGRQRPAPRLRARDAWREASAVHAIGPCAPRGRQQAPGDDPSRAHPPAWHPAATQVRAGRHRNCHVPGGLIKITSRHRNAELRTGQG